MSHDPWVTSYHKSCEFTSFFVFVPLLLVMVRSSRAKGTVDQPSGTVAPPTAAGKQKSGQSNARALNDTSCAPKERPATSSRTKSKVSSWVLDTLFAAYQVKQRPLLNLTPSPVGRNLTLNR